MKIFSLIFLSILMQSMCLSAQEKKDFRISGIAGSYNSDISLKVMKRAYEKIGAQIYYIPRPGARSLKEANNGVYDGELFRINNMSKKFKNLVKVKVPINRLQGFVFSKNKNVKITKWDDLKNYKTGIQRGIKFVERGTQGIETFVADSNEQLFTMLEYGRVEVVVVSLVNGLKTLKKMKIKNVFEVYPPLQEYELFHYIHQKNAYLVPKLENALKEMEKNGEIQKIRIEMIEKLK